MISDWSRNSSPRILYIIGTKTTYKLLIIERTREWNGSSVSFQLHYFWGNVPNCGPCMTNINPLYFATDLTDGFMSQICHRSLFNLKLLQVPQLSKKRSESLSACICNTALMKNLRMKNLRGWRQYLEAFKFTRHWRYPVKGQWWHLGATVASHLWLLHFQNLCHERCLGPKM